MNRIFCTLAICVTMIAADNCLADIYRYDGDDEVVSFTDSPLDNRFKLIQKEKRSRVSKRESSMVHSRAENRESGAQQAMENGGSTRNLPVQGRITSFTGMRSDPFDGKLKHHNGLDIAAPTGTPVKPVAPGTVIFSGWKSGYGNTVILDHHDGMVTVYAHHSSNNVIEGETVDLNSVIALTGSTGRSTGPHLHFEAWRSGANITSEFIPGSTAGRQSDTVASAPINRYLQPDGTIIFTNMR